MAELDGCKILIVDDDRFIRTTIKMVLRSIGRFEVAEAEDGDLALVKADGFRPDVVLCDVSMPRMDGLQFVARLRGHPVAQMRGTPVVMLTGQAEEATVQDAVKLQVSGFLVKPVSPKALGAQLRKILGQGPAIRQG